MAGAFRRVVAGGSLQDRLPFAVRHSLTRWKGLRTVREFSLAVGTSRLSPPVRNLAPRIFIRYHGGHGHHHHEMFTGNGPEGSSDNMRDAERITVIGAGTNLGLGVTKAIVGVLCNSTVLVVDAAHSISDLFSDGVTLVALRMAQQPKDDLHPYGHGRFETLGSMVVGMALLATGAGFGWNAIESVLHAADGSGPSIPEPSNAAMVMAVSSILCKEALYQATMRVGERLRSSVLIANAWHHRSDSLSSIIAVVGIGGAQMGFIAADPIAGCLVAGMLMRVGANVLIGAGKEVLDEQDVGLARHVEAIAVNRKGIKEVRRVRTRKTGPFSIVDIAVSVDREMTVSIANNLASSLRHDVVNLDGYTVGDCSISVECDNEIQDDDDPQDLSLRAGVRSPAAIENDVRDALIKQGHFPEIEDVSHVTLIMDSGKVMARVEVVVPDDLTVSESRKVVERAARYVRKRVADLDGVDIHLELGIHDA